MSSVIAMDPFRTQISLTCVLPAGIHQTAVFHVVGLTLKQLDLNLWG